MKKTKGDLAAELAGIGIFILLAVMMFLVVSTSQCAPPH